jgi:L-ascorbate metabolism protein UlaG (beta-lactamase superfamily)
MIISWYGHSCFKIQTRTKRGGEEVTLITDPFDKSIGLRPPQGQTDIVTISHPHYDHNNTSLLKGDFFTIDAPGEYSIKDISIEGIDSFHDIEKGEKRGRNTIFVIESEDIRICHLGDLGEKLNEKQLERMNGVDILMIPIGGTYTLDGKLAEEVIAQVEPKIIIPMHYKIPGLAIDIDDEKVFCAEMGNCPKETTQKLILKKKDIEEKENEIVLMSILNS